jgi:hypothetical protein
MTIDASEIEAVFGMRAVVPSRAPTPNLNVGEIWQIEAKFN